MAGALSGRQRTCHSHYRTALGQRATLVAITGWAQERDERDALAAGFDHHLTKPINPDDLRLLFSVKLTPPILRLHAAQL